MAKNGQQKPAKSGRSVEAILRSQVRKFYNVLQSSGPKAASNWLSRGPKRTVGRGQRRVDVILPIESLRKSI